MDWTWLKDYGTFIAASVAAVAAVLNGVLHYRRDQNLRRNEWLRNTRLPRYVEFLEASLAYRTGIFGELGEWDHDLGPEPPTWPDYHDTGDQFRRAFAAIVLLGPANVTARAREVQFSMWRYQAQLERDSHAYDQKLSNRMLDAYTSACQEALDIPSTGARETEYRSWLASHVDNEDA
jgi:hypothetical protein